jgi:hypothetical protein
MSPRGIAQDWPPGVPYPGGKQPQAQINAAMYTPEQVQALLALGYSQQQINQAMGVQYLRAQEEQRDERKSLRERVRGLVRRRGQGGRLRAFVRGSDVYEVYVPASYHEVPSARGWKIVRGADLVLDCGTLEELEQRWGGGAA